MSKEDSGWDVDSDEDLEEVDIDGTKGQAVLDLERTHTSDVVEESRQGDENFNRDVRKKEDEEKEGVGEEQEVADWSDDGEEEEDLDLSERLGGMTILEEKEIEKNRTDYRSTMPPPRIPAAVLERGQPFTVYITNFTFTQPASIKQDIITNILGGCSYSDIRHSTDKDTGLAKALFVDINDVKSLEDLLQLDGFTMGKDKLQIRIATLPTKAEPLRSAPADYGRQTGSHGSGSVVTGGAPGVSSIPAGGGGVAGEGGLSSPGVAVGSSGGNNFQPRREFSRGGWTRGESVSSHGGSGSGVYLQRQGSSLLDRNVSRSGNGRDIDSLRRAPLSSGGGGTNNFYRNDSRSGGGGYVRGSSFRTQGGSRGGRGGGEKDDFQAIGSRGNSNRGGGSSRSVLKDDKKDDGQKRVNAFALLAEMESESD